MIRSRQDREPERAGLDETRPSIMTLDEVARYLRVHRSTVYRMAREGSIPSMKVANQWRFHKNRIDRWLVEGEAIGTEAAPASARTGTHG